MLELVNLRRDGNGSAVTLPKKMLEELGWIRGDKLVVELDGNALVLHKLDRGDLPRRRDEEPTT